MGGRGARLGKYYLGGKWHTYGDEYETVLKSGNIKFVQRKDGKATTAPMETMTKGRIYVTINSNHFVPAHITYYDKENKRFKQIDITHPHNGLKPHVHHGYEHNENDRKEGATSLNYAERKIYDKVMELWHNYVSK